MLSSRRLKAMDRIEYTADWAGLNRDFFFFWKKNAKYIIKHRKRHYGNRDIVKYRRWCENRAAGRINVENDRIRVYKTRKTTSKRN